MRDYQVEGLNFVFDLHNNGVSGAILADEMGLGKTLQSISLIGRLKEANLTDGVHLVVVPLAVLNQWIGEFDKFCPELKIIKFHGDAATRHATKQLITDGAEIDVMVTTYEMVNMEKGFLKKKLKIDVLIIDEAHRLKNEATKLSRAVRELDTKFRLLLTGTPLQNNLHELWALLNFMFPKVFAKSAAFDEMFDIKEGHADESSIRGLHGVLRNFMIRRMKADVEKALLPKIETKLYMGLSEMQQEVYRAILVRDPSLGGTNGSTAANKKRSSLMNIAVQLRKACNHPYLFDGKEPGPPFTNGPHLWKSSGKMIVLHKLLEKLIAAGSRVLIFSQMSRMLDIISDYLVSTNQEHCRIDGSMGITDREAQLEAFREEGATVNVFLLSTRAGGLGLNLTSADSVILYDSDWNPHADLQAIARVHRIGQTKQVQVYRFVAEGTIDEQICVRAEKKLFLDAMVMQHGHLSENSQLSGDELLAMVKFGADREFKSSAEVTDADIDALIDQGRQKTDALSKKLENECQKSLADFKFDGSQDVSQREEFLQRYFVNNSAPPTAEALKGLASGAADAGATRDDADAARVASGAGTNVATATAAAAAKTQSRQPLNVLPLPSGRTCKIWGVLDWDREQHEKITLNIPTSVLLDRSMKIRKVAAGRQHVVMITEQYKLMFMGVNNRNLVVSATDNAFYSPTPIMIQGKRTAQQVMEWKQLDFVDVACGEEHTAALTSTGQVWTFGAGESGELGRSSDRTARPTPVFYDTGARICRVSCGSNATYTVTTTGEVFSWGLNSNGCLGLGIPGLPERAVEIPQKVKGLQHVTIVQVSAGNSHMMALDSAGQVYCCGMHSYGRLGLGDRRSHSSPQLVKQLRHIPMTQIAAGYEHSVALSEDGQMYWWGRARGDSDKHSVTPEAAVVGEVPMTSKIVSISAGRGQSYAVTANGQLWTFGKSRITLDGCDLPIKTQGMVHRVMGPLANQEVIGLTSSTTFCIALCGKPTANNTYCTACGEGGDVVLCDTCEACYHTYCTADCIPGEQLPDNWSCWQCCVYDGRAKPYEPAASMFSPVAKVADIVRPSSFSLLPSMKNIGKLVPGKDLVYEGDHRRFEAVSHASMKRRLDEIAVFREGQKRFQERAFAIKQAQVREQDEEEERRQRVQRRIAIQAQERDAFEARRSELQLQREARTRTGMASNPQVAHSAAAVEDDGDVSFVGMTPAQNVSSADRDAERMHRKRKLEAHWSKSLKEKFLHNYKAQEQLIDQCHEYWKEMHEANTRYDAARIRYADTRKRFVSECCQDIPPNTYKLELVEALTPSALRERQEKTDEKWTEYTLHNKTSMKKLFESKFQQRLAKLKADIATKVERDMLIHYGRPQSAGAGPAVQPPTSSQHDQQYRQPGNNSVAASGPRVASPGTQPVPDEFARRKAELQAHQRRMVNGGASTPTDSLRCSGDSNESSSFTETRDGNEVPSIAGYGASAGMHYHSTSLQARDDDQAVIQHSRAAQPAAAPDVTPQKALEPNDMMVKMSSVMGAMSPDSPPSHPDGPEHKKPRIAAQDAQTLGQQDQPQPEESAAAPEKEAPATDSAAVSGSPPPLLAMTGGEVEPAATTGDPQPEQPLMDVEVLTPAAAIALADAAGQDQAPFTAWSLPK